MKQRRRIKPFCFRPCCGCKKTERAVAYRFLFVFIFLLFSIFFKGNKFVIAQTSAPQDDTQLWADAQFAVPLTKTVDLNFNFNPRFGDNLRRVVDTRGGVGVTFRVGKYLSFSPSYAYIVTTPAVGRRASENRLNFAATVRFPLGKFTASDRSLFERRIRAVNSTRYRNRLQIERGVNFGDFKLGLFASNEVFYDWSINRWVRNRFMIGASRTLNKKLALDFYYMRQNDGRSRPGDLHVAGTTLRVRL